MSEPTPDARNAIDVPVVSSGDGAKDPEFQEHGLFSLYMRDLILGANDGLVSVFLLIAGVVGGQLSGREVLLAGLAAAVAGAISMSIGEYLSTKSQAEVHDAEIELERDHLKHHRQHEIDELYEMFGDMGFEGDLLTQMVNKLDENDDNFLKAMMLLEFGIQEEEGRRSPTKNNYSIRTLLVFLALIQFALYSKQEFPSNPFYHIG